jgi:hypothetical protein
MKMCKGPNDSPGSEAACNLWIIANIVEVVEVRELMRNRLAEDEGHSQQK